MLRPISLFHSVQFSCSVVSNSLWPHEPQHTRPPCPTPTHGAYPNSCPLSQWCHPTISSSCCPLFLLPSIFPSIRVFSNESALCIRWPKYWSFSFNISPSNEYSGLISFRMDWLDLLDTYWASIMHEYILDHATCLLQTQWLMLAIKMKWKFSGLWALGDLVLPAMALCSLGPHPNFSTSLWHFSFFSALQIQGVFSPFWVLGTCYFSFSRRFIFPSAPLSACR